MTLKSSLFERSPLMLFEREMGPPLFPQLRSKSLLVRVTSRSQSPSGFEGPLCPTNGGYCSYSPYRVEGSHERRPPMSLQVQSPNLVCRPSSGWESLCRLEGIQTCLRLLGKLSDSRYQRRKRTREEHLQSRTLLFVSLYPLRLTREFEIFGSSKDGILFRSP